MTIDEKIRSIKTKINYDYNQMIKDTLFPFDSFVKTATVEALREIARDARIIERSVLIPMENQKRLYDIVLAVLTKHKLSVSQPKSLVILNNESAVRDISHVYLEDIISGGSKNDCAIEFASQIDGDKYYLRTFNKITADHSEGKYETITVISSPTVLRISNVANATEDYNIVNLENTIDYTYQKIESIAGNDITVNSTAGFAVGDKIYISESEPNMLLFTFSGVPTLDYFETETIIPIQEQFLDVLDNFIIANLFAYLIARDIKSAQIFSALVQVGVVKTKPYALREIKQSLNAKFNKASIPCYNPLYDEGQVSR